MSGQLDVALPGYVTPLERCVRFVIGPRMPACIPERPRRAVVGGFAPLDLVASA